MTYGDSMGNNCGDSMSNNIGGGSITWHPMPVTPPAWPRL